MMLMMFVPGSAEEATGQREGEMQRRKRVCVDGSLRCASALTGSKLHGRME